MWYWLQEQTAEKTLLIWERPVTEITDSLADRVVLGHKSFRSQSFVLTAGLPHHTGGIHLARGNFKDPHVSSTAGAGTRQEPFLLGSRTQDSFMVEPVRNIFRVFLEWLMILPKHFCYKRECQVKIIAAESGFQDIHLLPLHTPLLVNFTLPMTSAPVLCELLFFLLLNL
jgi:hypothetical protein